MAFHLRRSKGSQPLPLYIFIAVIAYFLFSLASLVLGSYYDRVMMLTLSSTQNSVPESTGVTIIVYPILNNYQVINV